MVKLRCRLRAVLLMAMIMGLPWFQVAWADLNEGLVAHYPFDGNADDESGNGNDGSVNGAIEYVEGIVRQAAKLDGTNTYIRIANPVQKFDTQYTITGWVYTEGRGGNLVGKYTWGAPGGGRGFNLSSTTEGGNGVGHAGSTFFAEAMFNEGWNPSKYPKYTMPIGEFQYITAVYDEGNVKIYINGIVEAEKTVSHSGTLDNPYDMLIGTYWTSNGTKIVAELTNRTFDGLIDELRLYNRALSECEIKSLYTGKDECKAMLVTLNNFAVTPFKNDIRVHWKTASEVDNAGFHLWRAIGEGWKQGDYSQVMRLTNQLISSKGTKVGGYPYSYIDSNVESGVTYYYVLEDIDFNGQSTVHSDFIDKATAK